MHWNEKGKTDHSFRRRIEDGVKYEGLCTLLGVSKMLSLPPHRLTSRGADAVPLRVEEPADLHETAVSLGDVLVHRRLEQVGELALPHARHAFLRRVDEHARLGRRHEVPHALVGWYLRRLEVDVSN